MQRKNTNAVEGKKEKTKPKFKKTLLSRRILDLLHIGQPKTLRATKRSAAFSETNATPKEIATIVSNNRILQEETLTESIASQTSDISSSRYQKDGYSIDTAGDMFVQSIRKSMPFGNAVVKSKRVLGRSSVYTAVLRASGSMLHNPTRFSSVSSSHS
jgi:hypothetical protein